MKILIADEHALFRDTVALFINEISPESVVLQVNDFAQGLKILQKEQNIDLILIDVDALYPNAVKQIEKLKNLLNPPQIAVISASEDLEQIKKILQTGISAYIPRQTDLSIFKEAFNALLKGQKYVPQALKDIENDVPEKFTAKKLTNRQSQVLDLIAQGKSNKQIAYEMGVSEATVKLHINALLRSLKVNNRTQAVITAQKIGLI